MMHISEKGKATSNTVLIRDTIPFIRKELVFFPFLILYGLFPPMQKMLHRSVIHQQPVDSDYDRDCYRNRNEENIIGDVLVNIQKYHIIIYWV